MPGPSANDGGPPVEGKRVGAQADGSLPVLLIVSGPPGAGKSTAARVLSDYLCVPVITCDLIKAGVTFSAGPSTAWSTKLPRDREVKPARSCSG